MASTYTDNGGGAPNGSDLEFTYTFPVLKTEDVKVALNNVVQATTKYTVDNVSNPTKITFNNTSVNSTLQESSGAPKSGVTVRVFRQTTVGKANGDEDPKAVFAAGSSIRAADLNANQEQALFAIHELQDRPITETNLGDGSVLTSKIADANVTTAKIADDNVTMAKLGSGALPTDITVASANLVDGTIVNADVNASAAIDGSKIQASSGSNSGTMSSANFTKLAGIETGATADQTNAEIRAAVEAATDSNVFTDADHSKLNAIEASATADQTASEIKTLLQSDKLTLSEMNTTSLDSRYFTETESDARYFRQDSSETIASGDTWSSADTHVATTGAINARIVDLIDDVGGFTAITSEQHFPNTNPQGSTGQAAILSIQAASTTLTPSGTTVTISNCNLANNANITITGVTSTIPTGFGFLVESTSTLHTYTFHRLVPKATEVTTVAGIASAISTAATNVADINNFSDIYIISSSAPTQRADGSSLQEGDLWFDSSNDNLQVYTGSAFSIITPSQSVLDDVAIVSGAITYSEDLGLITDAASTGSSNGSLDIVADALEDEITFTVTAATGKFIIDGVDKPALTLYKGWTYTFDVSDASNANHPLRFSSGGSAYNTGVTVTGTQGQAGAKVQLVVPESQPTSFIYYCTSHSGMGNSITVKDDPIKTVSDISANIVSVANNSTNINTTAGSISNVNTVGASIADVNRYANEYQISANAPSSPSVGDLWFDTTNNVLKNYNGTIWAGITSNSGIASVVDDTTPQLGGALDGQNNNMSNIGTIDGANLQLDFGTL